MEQRLGNLLYLGAKGGDDTVIRAGRVALNIGNNFGHLVSKAFELEIPGEDILGPMDLICHLHKVEAEPRSFDQSGYKIEDRCPIHLVWEL